MSYQNCRVTSRHRLKLPARPKHHVRPDLAADPGGGTKKNRCHLVSNSVSIALITTAWGKLLSQSFEMLSAMVTLVSGQLRNKLAKT